MCARARDKKSQEQVFGISEQLRASSARSLNKKQKISTP
jgi:hypothetical protein